MGGKGNCHLAVLVSQAPQGQDGLSKGHFQLINQEFMKVCPSPHKMEHCKTLSCIESLCYRLYNYCLGLVTSENYSNAIYSICLF